MTETVKLEPLNLKTAVAIGYFDAVHLGHRLILDTAVRYAKEMELFPAVFTFEMGSRRASGKGKKDLIPLRTKKKQIASLGIEYYVSPAFEDICDMTGKEFVENILTGKCLNAAVVVCGKDFRFGKNRECGIKELAKYCGPYGIQVITVDPVMMDGDRISTTRIKAELEKGNIQAVNKMLGYNYGVEGTVIHGNHVARDLGFPTANVLFPEECVLPQKGVYISDTFIDGMVFRGITNIGTRPTLTEDEQAVVETYMIDLDQDIYGFDINVTLLKFVRPEQKFDSVDELVEKVNQNIELAKTLIIG